MSLEIVLASVLLATDAEPPQPLVEALAPTLLALMVSAELDAPLHRNSVYAGKWPEVAKRIAEMRLLPRVADSQFTITREQLAELVTRNRAYRAWLVCRRANDFFGEAAIDDAIIDADRLLYLYQLALTAADEKSPFWARRHALGELRATIGDEMFFAGRLPGP